MIWLIPVVWLLLLALVQMSVYGGFLTKDDHYLADNVLNDEDACLSGSRQIILCFGPNHYAIGVIPLGIVAAYFVLNTDGYYRLIPRWWPVNKLIKEKLRTLPTASEKMAEKYGKIS